MDRNMKTQSVTLILAPDENMTCTLVNTDTFNPSNYPGLPPILRNLAP